MPLACHYARPNEVVPGRSVQSRRALRLGVSACVNGHLCVPAGRSSWQRGRPGTRSRSSATTPPAQSRRTLRAHRLTQHIAYVAGQPYAQPDRMKPTPEPLASDECDRRRAWSVRAGDRLREQAAEGATLHGRRADVVLTSMGDIGRRAAAVSWRSVAGLPASPTVRRGSRRRPRRRGAVASLVGDLDPTEEALVAVVPPRQYGYVYAAVDFIVIG